MVMSMLILCINASVSGIANGGWEGVEEGRRLVDGGWFCVIWLVGRTEMCVVVGVSL